MTEKNRVDEIIEAENSVLDEFQTKWDLAVENKRFYKLDPYSEEQKNEFLKKGRDWANFDKTSHAMNVLLGSQRENRLDITFLERTPEDAHRVEVLNSTWKYFADINEFQYRESDMFQDGIINDCGILGLKIDTDKYYGGDLKVFRVPFDQVMWDTNSRTYDLSFDDGTGAQWFRRAQWYRKNDLIKQYPDKREVIDLAGIDGSLETGVRPLNTDTWYDTKRELVGVREFYERDFKRKYLIWQVGTEVPEEGAYASKEDAEKVIAERMAQFMPVVAEAMAMGQPAMMPQFEILPFDCPVILKTVAILNGVLEDRVESEPFIPYSLYFAYFNDGDYWTAIERMKDPQMFYNRMMMQADYSIGTSAKGVLRIDPRLPKNVKDQIRTNWAKTGGTFEAPAGKVEMFESRGPQPQLFSMMDRAENIMDETFGGGNALGLKQTASESGRAVLARQAQAGLDNFVPLDNLRRTKLDLGKKIAWYLTNKITTARQLRITGNSLEMQSLIQSGIAQPHEFRPDVGYVEINTKPENRIESLEVDVIVSESQYSPSRMIAAQAAMTDAFKSGFVPVPPPIQVAIQMLPIPENLKQQWMASAQPKDPEPKIALNISYKDLPPGIQAQVESEILKLQPQPEENVAQKLVQATKDTAPALTQKEKEAGGQKSSD